MLKCIGIVKVIWVFFLDCLMNCIYVLFLCGVWDNIIWLVCKLIFIVWFMFCFCEKVLFEFFVESVFRIFGIKIEICVSGCLVLDWMMWVFFDCI